MDGSDSNHHNTKQYNTFSERLIVTASISSSILDGERNQNQLRPEEILPTRGGLQLTPVATYEVGIVGTNILEGNHITSNYIGIPVGLQEEAARKQDLQFKTNKADTSRWYTSRRIGENHRNIKS